MKSKLYLIKKSFYGSSNYESLKKLLAIEKENKEKIGMVFIEDAVINLTGKIGDELNSICSDKIKIYALKEDIESRGISNLIKINQAKPVNYRELINLILNEFEHLINYT